MSLDLERVRQDTPGCEQVLHFNNAGSALTTRQSLDAVKNYLDLEATIGGYEAAARTRDQHQAVYNSIAKLINAEPDEIALAENATRAWDMAFYSIPFKAGDRILTAMAEYSSNFVAFLQVARRTGAIIDVVPSDESGQLSTGALREMLDERVKLIAVTHVPTNGGLVNPAEEIGKIANEAGILYLLDACQSAGQMPLDVRKIGCDFLSATGRKYLRGPRGTGFLYVSKAILQDVEPPILDSWAASWVSVDRFEMLPTARRFETFEGYMAGRLGLGAAIDYALELGLDTTYARVKGLASELRSRLNDMPGVAVYDLGQEKCGIVTFKVKDFDSMELYREFSKQGINVTVTQPEGARIDNEARQLPPLVRASVHYYNSAVEIERFCRVLNEVVTR